MAWLILIAIAVTAWWIVREIRENRRQAQIEAIRRPDWQPPRECPVCDQPMQMMEVKRADPDPIGSILFCSRSKCPVFLEGIYYRQEGVWCANPVVIPVVQAASGYKKEIALSGSKEKANVAAYAAYDKAYAEFVEPLTEDQVIGLRSFRMLASLELGFLGPMGEDSTAAMDYIQGCLKKLEADQQDRGESEEPASED